MISRRWVRPIAEEKAKIMQIEQITASTGVEFYEFMALLKLIMLYEP